MEQKILSRVSRAYFDDKLKGWVYRGYIFENESGNKFALFQTLFVWGGDEIVPRGAMYSLLPDESSPASDPNAFSYKLIGYYGPGSSGYSELKANGFLELVQGYADPKSLTHEEGVGVVNREIRPSVEQEVLSINTRMADINNLASEQLVSLVQDVLSLAKKIVDFYPQSHSNLLDLTVAIRERYAAVKHPELYEELKKFHTDQDYKKDPGDEIVGFGPNIVYRYLFSEYFLRYLPRAHKDQRRDSRSPLESPREPAFSFVGSKSPY